MYPQTKTMFSLESNIDYVCLYDPITSVTPDKIRVKTSANSFSYRSMFPLCSSASRFPRSQFHR